MKNLQKTKEDIDYRITYGKIINVKSTQTYKGEVRKMTKAKTVGAVHAHTHTQVEF